MGNFYYYGIDSLYLYLVVPAIIIAVILQVRVKSTFAKFSAFHCHMSGADAALKVLAANGVTGVRIERVSGSLTDHYDPRTNVIRLSDSVYDAYNISAVGVAAHEAGHAVQYAKGYTPIKLRAVILPVCNLGSQLSLPLLIIGLIFNFYFLVKLGVIFFCGALVFQLITLPVEFNASNRAMQWLESSGTLHGEHLQQARTALSWAARTYVVAALSAIATLLYYIGFARRD